MASNEKGSTNGTSAPKRGRSPSYPGIKLERALELARKLYNSGAQDREMPIGGVLAGMGYKPSSGKGNLAVSALKQFGLLADSGKGATRKATLTDLALRIIRDGRPDQTARKARIKEAALMPSVHSAINAQYGPSPDPEVLRYHLENEMGFTPKGARGLISEYAATIAFAEIVRGDRLDEGAGDNELRGGDDAHGVHEPPPPPKERAMPELHHDESRDLTLLLTGGRMAVLRAPVEISDEDYNLITGQLKAMKSAFVTMAATTASARPADEESEDQD